MADLLRARLRIHLQEYGAPLIVEAHQIDVRALAEANKRWTRALGLTSDPIRVEDLGDGRVRLRAEAVTGVVRVGETDIEIAPKFLSTAEGSWQTVLWRILAVVEGGHIDDELTTAHKVESLSLPDLLAEMFLASYAKGAARGLPRSYRTEKSEGPVLRGALDLSRLGQWIARPWEMPYIADLLTEDTPLARLIRWAAECLAATVKNPGRARATREIASSLGHVDRRPPHILDAQRIVLGTQHRGLEPARLVGALLLEGAGVHHAMGAQELSGFLWNSDVIYENYVFWLCRRAASQRGHRVSKVPAKFGELIAGSGTLLQTTPDVVFADSLGKIVAVTDSKYKRFGSRPKAADTYQVLTAAHVLGCQRVSLTYPVEQDRKATVWKVSSGLGAKDVELSALPLNLMVLTQPEGPHLLINKIVDWLDGDLFGDSAVKGE